MNKERIVAGCNQLRTSIEIIKSELAFLRSADLDETIGDPNETKANLTLAFRCLENGRMRLGKAIQATTEDGASKYDKTPT